MRTLLIAAAVAATLVGALRATDTPTLTPLEQARVENVNLRHLLRVALQEADTCRGQLAQPRADGQLRDLQREIATLKADVERNHPGYSWDANTGTFTVKGTP